MNKKLRIRHKSCLCWKLISVLDIFPVLDINPVCPRHTSTLFSYFKNILEISPVCILIYNCKLVPGVCHRVCPRFTATVFNPGYSFLACDLSRPWRWFSTYWGQPPWPPRSKEAIPDLDMLKLTEGVIFKGCIINPKLLSDLDLGGPDALRRELRGQMRSLRSKIQFG